MVRPTGIELVSSAPQADTLSIELWALKSDWLRVTYYIIILTFLVLHFNQIYPQPIAGLTVYSIISFCEIPFPA